MFKVIKFFTDMQDNNYAYKVGDEFPRKGLVVSEGRLEELSSDKNRRGYPLIVLVKDVSKESREEATPPTPESEEVKEAIMPEPETEIEPETAQVEKPKSKGRKGKTKDAE